VALGAPARLVEQLGGRTADTLAGSALGLGPPDARWAAVPVGADEVVVVACDHPAVRLEAVPAVDGSRPHVRLTLDGFPKADAAACVGGDRLHDDWVARLGAVAALDAVGAARTALGRTLDHARERRQFDRPIGSFQAYQHRCATAFVELKLAQSLAFRAADHLDGGGRALALAAAVASTAAAVFVCGEAVQLHGGIGFTWEAGLHVLLKRARADEIVAAADGATARLLLRATAEEEP
jgi:alkylation response protein AidB-like acyl-CoA dehydrogenase